MEGNERALLLKGFLEARDGKARVQEINVEERKAEIMEGQKRSAFGEYRGKEGKGKTRKEMERNEMKLVSF